MDNEQEPKVHKASSADMKVKRILAAAKFGLLLVMLIGVPLFLYFRFGDDLFSKDAAYRIIDYLNAHKSISVLLLIGLQIMQVIICVVPGQPIQFASSYMFGVIPGLLLSLIGAVIGTCISFFAAGILGRDAVELLFGKEKVSDYHKKLNSGRGLMIVLLVYLIPGIPKDLLSYVGGISGMRIKPFLIVSTIGRIPGMSGSLLLGYFFRNHNYAAIGVLAVLTAVVLIICFIYRDKLLGLLDDLEAADEGKEA